ERVKTTAEALHQRQHRQIIGSDGAALRLDDPVEILRHDVITFAHEVGRALNHPTANVSGTPLLDYLDAKRMLREAIGELWAQLDSFEALGVYRWRGDPQSADEFTGWIRRFKSGEASIGEHLGAAM